MKNTSTSGYLGGKGGGGYPYANTAAQEPAHFTILLFTKKRGRFNPSLHYDVAVFWEFLGAEDVLKFCRSPI